MKPSIAISLFAAALAAASCGSSSNPTSPSPSTGAVTINITGQNGAQSFNPSPTTVNVGQQVVWKNTDNTSHDASQDAGSFATPVLGPGATSSPVTMNTRGTFTYHCTIHPGMVGTITVQ